jgi:UDP-N-acetylmuramate dehydrogenase
MSGIPGSIGGVLRMNAGAWGDEIGDLVRRVTVMDRDGDFYELRREELEFTYRRMTPANQGLRKAVIIDALLQLRPERQREIIARCRDLVTRRRQEQPVGMASAGSFFKNPPGDSAGRLIDAAGLKGLSRGDAMVSPRHANFIVNTGSASADDILGLMHEVQEKVFASSGVRLEPEVHVI